MAAAKKKPKVYVAQTGITWRDGSRTEKGEDVPEKHLEKNKWLIKSGKVK